MFVSYRIEISVLKFPSLTIAAQVQVRLVQALPRAEVHFVDSRRSTSMSRRSPITRLVKPILSLFSLAVNGSITTEFPDFCHSYGSILCGPCGQVVSETPEIRKYKKRFNSDIHCAALWGVNLLIGTDDGLMLLDRSGQGRVYTLISR